MICGHGSRDETAIREFGALARHFRARLPEYDVESGFLEFARPVIRDGLEALKSRGASRIICVPGMLFAAGHVKNDLPAELNAFAAANPGIEVLFGRELAVDPRLIAASAARIEEAELRARLAVEAAEILRARFAKIPERNRPYYTPAQRFRILEIRSVLAWNAPDTARAFLVCPNTILNWEQAADPVAASVGSTVDGISISMIGAREQPWVRASKYACSI
jgi:hypothetical protein